MGARLYISCWADRIQSMVVVVVVASAEEEEVVVVVALLGCMPACDSKVLWIRVMIPADAEVVMTHQRR